MYRASSIGLTESQILGSELHQNTQAKLLGKALSAFTTLDPIERAILILMEKPMTLRDLLILTQEFNQRHDAIFAAVISLLRNRFILLNTI